MKKILISALIVLATISLGAQNNGKTQKQAQSSQTTSVQQKSGKSKDSAAQDAKDAKAAKDAKDAKATKDAKDKKDNDKKQEEENNEDFYSKLRFGATGGMGLYLGRPAMFQIRGGVDARMPFILPHAYLMAGSRLSLRGCSPVPFEKLRTLYLEVPVRLGYTLPLDDNLAFFVEAGPYLDVRLIRFKKHDTSCARFLDLGLGGDAGLELGHKFRFSLGLDFGFIPPCTGEHAHNNGIWLSGAYLF